jgi:UDP-glucose 4-epimerase
MRRVLVTHVDSPVGRRLIKALYHDTDVSLVLGTGTGPTPSFLEPYRDKCAYQRIDLAKARHIRSFFNSERFARARLDSVIHLSFPHEHPREHIPGNVPTLVSETRRLLEECRSRACLHRFVYLSSGFVYRPEPGNANLVSEEQLLGFETEADAEVRAWIDADLICQGELNDPALCMTILRAASIVTEAGEFLHSPPLERAGTPVGFDPVLSLVADRDVARALCLALHSDRPGIYNIAGDDVFPRSELRHDVRRVGPLPLPGLLGDVVALARQALGRGQRGRTGFHSYGLVLDTHRAAETLGFEPQYRIEVRSSGIKRSIDTVRYR